MSRFRTRKPADEPDRSHAAGLDLRSLLNASQAVNSVLGLEDSLRVVLSTARELTGAHEGSVMLSDPDGVLRILASEGIPTEIVASTRLKLGEGVAGRVAMTGQPMLMNEAPAKGAYDSYVGSDRTLVSSISVPLRAAGLTLGVLNLNRTRGSQTFGSSDMELAQLFAEQAAMALHKAQLLDDANQRSNDLAVLLEGSQGLLGLLQPEPLLTRILDGVMRITQARVAFVALLDQQARRLLLVVYQGITRDEIREMFARPGTFDLFHEGVSTTAVSDLVALSLPARPEDCGVLFNTKAEGNTVLLGLAAGPALAPTRVTSLKSYLTQAGTAVRNAQLYERVEEKEAELASIVYSMAQPVIVADTSGRLAVANPAAEELFGISLDFVKGQPIRGMLNDDTLEGLLLGDQEQTIDVAAGRPLPRQFKARVAKIRAADARMAGRILVMDDVTAEREMEKLKSDFVAVVGHELRTPLTLIKGFVKTLIRKGAEMSDEQRGDALLTMESQAQRLERLIEDLLYVSNIETSRPPLHLEAADLSTLTRGLLEEFAKREPQRQFSFLAPTSLPMMLDKTKTEQIIYHLVDNACKYSEPETPVMVEVSDRLEAVEVAVTDKGIGILSGEIPHLFERFHQVDATSTREVGGTGVGLYIVKNLVEAHGGHVSVDSVWGKGSTFRFTIPKGLRPGPEVISRSV